MNEHLQHVHGTKPGDEKARETVRVSRLPLNGYAKRLQY